VSSLRLIQTRALFLLAPPQVPGLLVLIVIGPVLVKLRKNEGAQLGAVPI